VIEKVYGGLINFWGSYFVAGIAHDDVKIDYFTQNLLELLV
jgi:hypothetical protein